MLDGVTVGTLEQRREGFFPFILEKNKHDRMDVDFNPLLWRVGIHYSVLNCNCKQTKNADM